MGLTVWGTMCTLRAVMPKSFSAIIELWPTLGALADDLGVGYESAKAYKRRDSIPPEHWETLVAAARRRQIEGVSLESLAALAAKRKAA